MKNIVINKDYKNPEDNDLEIIEKKGLGHPDSLADQLAKECSRVYSLFCLEKFGCILHHNFDKLYIGAGCFRYENKRVNMYQPIKVILNGRASNTMNGEKIDIESLLTPVIKKYLSSVLPRVDVEKELEININCTQNTKFKYWFSPRNIDDVPDSKELFANDTSLCISHYPMTFCERIAMEVSNFFWNSSEENEYPVPRFKDIGQDIKVMVFRIKNDIKVSIGVPVYYTEFQNEEEYLNIIKKYESKIKKEVLSTYSQEYYKITLEINTSENKKYHIYGLSKGSCIECGEEGVVGRGNNLFGLIPSFRAFSMESPFGKNERYHTGRVLSTLTGITVKKIYDELNIKCSMHCLTQNKDKLLEPNLLYISVNRNINKKETKRIEEIVKEEFNEETYLEKVLTKIIV